MRTFALASIMLLLALANKSDCQNTVEVFLRQFDRQGNVDRGDNDESYCCCKASESGCKDELSELTDCHQKCDLRFMIEPFNKSEPETFLEMSRVIKDSPLSTPLNYFFNLSIENAFENKLSLNFTANNYRDTGHPHNHLIDVVTIVIPTESGTNGLETLLVNGTRGIGTITFSYRVLTSSDGLSPDTMENAQCPISTPCSQDQGAVVALSVTLSLLLLIAIIALASITAFLIYKLYCKENTSSPNSDMAQKFQGGIDNSSYGLHESTNVSGGLPKSSQGGPDGSNPHVKNMVYGTNTLKNVDYHDTGPTQVHHAPKVHIYECN